MSVTCKHCHTSFQEDPLQCGICGAMLRKPRLNLVGKILMLMMLIGVITTFYAWGNIVCQMFDESPISCHWAGAKIALWGVGFYIYMKVLGLFEGFARNT